MKKCLLLLELLVILHGSVCSIEDNVMKTLEDYNEQIKLKELELQVLDSKIEASLKELSRKVFNKVENDADTVENLSEVKKEVARLKVSLGHKEESLRTCEINLRRIQEDKLKENDYSSFFGQLMGNKEKAKNNSSVWDKVKQIPQQITMYFSET